MSKLVVWINTVPERLKMYRQVIECLRHQTLKPDCLDICFDGFEHVPMMDALAFHLWTGRSSFTWTTVKQGTTQRLIGALSYNDNDVAAIIDDDILYPPDYLKRGMHDLQRLGGLVSYHGKNYPGMNARTQGMHFTQTVRDPHQIDVPGGGVTFAHMDLLKAIVKNAELKQFAFTCDMALAFGCWKLGVKIARAPSEAGWLKPFGTEGDSIWRTRKKERQAVVKFCVEQGWPEKSPCEQQPTQDAPSS